MLEIIRGLQQSVTTVTVCRMVTFVSYFRVSTDRQGRSGLGLDAQRSAVASYIEGVPDGELLAEFTEIESGKRNDRPELAAALALCKKHNARLIIAKLDRLARNVFFIAGLMESGVEFVACDMPYANRFTLHIMAAVAEHEREMIAKRTKDALAEKKKQGVRLGNPRPAESLAKGRATMSRQRAARLASIQPTVEKIGALSQQGLSFRAIARDLNQQGIPSPTGKQWHDVTVKRAINQGEHRDI
jgi:DNA invertase Pin-like site-specific DNA recombinase